MFDKVEMSFLLQVLGTLQFKITQVRENQIALQISKKIDKVLKKSE